MGSHLCAYCATCEEPGPGVRRSAAQPAVLVSTDHRIESAGDEWADFVAEHEYHDLRLMHKGDRPAELCPDPRAHRPSLPPPDPAEVEAEQEQLRDTLGLGYPR